MIDELLNFNKTFVETKGYEKYITNKYPDKKSPLSLVYGYSPDRATSRSLRNKKNGDVKSSRMPEVPSPPFSAMRSLLVAIYELGVEEVMIIGHTDCGVQHMDSETMLQHMRERESHKTILK